MAGSLKKIFIIGNLGRDPEMRYLQDGTPVTSFTVAVNERRRAQGPGDDAGQGGPGGQAEELTTWFRVTAWRRQAEIAKDLLKKGTSVFVSGDLRTSEYTDNSGKNRTTLEVTMQDMQILTPKGVQEFGGEPTYETPPAAGPSSGGSSYGRPRPAGGGGSYGQRQAPPADTSQDEEDIPF